MTLFRSTIFNVKGNKIILSEDALGFSVLCFRLTSMYVFIESSWLECVGINIKYQFFGKCYLMRY